MAARAEIKVVDTDDSDSGVWDAGVWELTQPYNCRSCGVPIEHEGMCNLLWGSWE